MSTNRAFVALDYLRQLTDGSGEDFGALLGELLGKEELASLPLWGRWYHNAEDDVWQRDSVDGLDAAYADENPGIAHWRTTIVPVADPYTWCRAPTLADAMRAADEALRAEGRILIGGIPDEVLLDGATATATVDEDGTIVGDPGEEAELERRPARGEEEAEAFASRMREAVEAVGSNARIVQEAAQTADGRNVVQYTLSVDTSQFRRELDTARRQLAAIFDVRQRHDWPLRGESCICRRCGLTRRRRGNAYVYFDAQGRRRTAGRCVPALALQPEEVAP